VSGGGGIAGAPTATQSAALDPKAAVMRRRALYDIAFVLLVVQSYVWFWNRLFDGGVFVVAALVLGTAIRSGHRRGEGLRDIGIRFDNFLPALRDAAVVTVPMCALIIIWGLWVERLRPDWMIVVNRLPWLVCWGFLQQFVLQGFVHRRFMEILGTTRERELATGLYFALCHLPNPRLMAATFVSGWIWAVLYRRNPNLIAIALSHAAGSASLNIAFGPEMLRGMRVGMGYLTYRHIPGPIIR